MCASDVCPEHSVQGESVSRSVTIWSRHQQMAYIEAALRYKSTRWTKSTDKSCYAYAHNSHKLSNRITEKGRVCLTTYRLLNTLISYDRSSHHFYLVSTATQLSSPLCMKFNNFPAKENHFVTPHVSRCLGAVGESCWLPFPTSH